MANSRDVPTTIAKIMAMPTFALGVADVREGRGPHPDRDCWSVNQQWSYERGRQWARLAPRDVALRQGGQINPAAIAWYARVSRHML
jgi:hypothetical protein